MVDHCWQNFTRVALGRPLLAKFYQGQPWSTIVGKNLSELTIVNHFWPNFIRVDHG